jgi:hypothetical protein
MSTHNDGLNRGASTTNLAASDDRVLPNYGTGELRAQHPSPRELNLALSGCLAVRLSVRLRGRHQPAKKSICHLLNNPKGVLGLVASLFLRCFALL